MMSWYKSGMKIWQMQKALFLTLELLFGFAGNQLIAQDGRKDDEQSQCSKMKPDNNKVFSRTFFLMFCNCNVN